MSLTLQELLGHGICSEELDKGKLGLKDEREETHGQNTK